MRILSLNARGLNKIIHRQLFFEKFKAYDICCVQEAYIVPQVVELWRSEWNGHFFFVPGDNHSGGLMILFKERLNCTNVKEIVNEERILGLTFTYDDEDYTLYNIYAPSVKEQRSPFFDDVLSSLHPNCKSENVIFCGDFNNLMDNHRDNISGNPHGIKEILSFKNFVYENDLTDCWRFFHPEERNYSLIRIIKGDDQRGTNTYCTARRLDYIFVSPNLKSNLYNCDMVYFPKTDHKAVIIDLKTSKFPRGPGTWRLNESLLDDEDFVNSMSSFITQHLKELNDDDEIPKGEVWDLLKIGIRDHCIAFSRNKNINSRNNNTEQLINELSYKLSKSPDDIEIIKDLAKACTARDVEEIAKSNKSYKMSKMKFIDEWEKNGAFFFGAGGSAYSHQTIKAVYTDDNKTTECPVKILSQLSKFYKELMTKKNTADKTQCKQFLDKFLKDIDIPKIPETKRIDLDRPLTLSEMDQSVKRLNPNASPGADGLTPGFYKTFWDLLRMPLLESFQDSIQNESLTLSQRRSILTLLKKDPNIDGRSISNYRPVALTNCDYKIYASILAARAHTVIGEIINENQAAYIRGRSINNHIREIDDIIQTANKESLEGVLLSLDYKKAFDSVSREAILETLERFNFGPQYIKYVATILNDTEVSVKNAGWISDWFNTSQGIRQGCGLSPLLFILVIELLSIKIRSDDSIESIFATKKDPHRNSKMKSYADDLNYFLKNILSVKNCLEVVDSFTHFSGLSLNRIKSLGLWIGSSKNNPPGGEGIKWLCKEDNIKILGIRFNSETEASLIKANWEGKIESLERTLALWVRQYITPIGKSLVSKIFLLSKLTNFMQPLVLPENIVKLVTTEL